MAKHRIEQTAPHVRSINSTLLDQKHAISKRQNSRNWSACRIERLHSQNEHEQLYSPPKHDVFLRFCTSYRKVNTVTVKHTYPFLRMTIVWTLGKTRQNTHILRKSDANSAFGKFRLATGTTTKQRLQRTTHCKDFYECRLVWRAHWARSSPRWTTYRQHSSESLHSYAWTTFPYFEFRRTRPGPPALCVWTTVEIQRVIDTKAMNFRVLYRLFEPCYTAWYSWHIDHSVRHDQLNTTPC